MGWSEDAFDVFLEGGIRQVAFVPDAGLSPLIEACKAEPSMITASPLSEEDGVGMAYGAWLGGDRAVMLMQSSGVGNCVNVFGMAQSCRMPLLIVVTMRGEWGEANPWQVPMSKAVAPVLQSVGFAIHRLEDAREARTMFKAAVTMAFESQQSVAVLVAQKVIGSKSFVEQPSL